MRLIVAAAIVGLAASVPAAWAHRLDRPRTPPDSWETAFRIEEADVSQVVYQGISAERPFVWLVFEGRKGQKLPAQLGVPRVDRFERFIPSYALVGPGLPASPLPFGVPPGAGALVISSPDQRKEFYEPVTGTDSWMISDTTITIPEDGTYWMVGWAEAPIPETPKMWMAIGTLERFSGADVAALPEWIAYVRGFHEVGGMPRWAGIAAFTAAAAAIVLTAILLR